MAKLLSDLVAWHKKRRREALFRKRYFADVPVDLEAMPQYRKELFPDSGPQPWIDRPDALAVLEQKIAAKEIDPADAEICRGLIVDGYYIARNLIASDVLDAAWQSYEEALQDNVVSVKPEVHGEGDRFPGRLLDPHLRISEVRDVLWHPEILRVTNLALGRQTVPFQTIIGHKSSQQLPHSDAIHMTTYPLGFLIAAWIAFEDVHPDSGPLEYYPKSHRALPYLLSADVGIEMMQFKANPSIYNERYERQLQERLDELGMKPVPFCGNKGDVLFWHHNLVHSGSRRRDLRHSRKALVCHYFTEGAFTYHDLSGNASRLHRNGVYANLATDGPPALRRGPAKTRGLFRILSTPKWLTIRRNALPGGDANDLTDVGDDEMAKPGKRIIDTTGSTNHHFGRADLLPAVVYEGPTRMLYRIWAVGAAGSSLRVEADGIVRTVTPANSVDVVGVKITVSAKTGSPSCDYQFLARDQ
jgi:hypothetical protein